VATRQRGNLPPDLTSFVGRRHEVGQVKRLLAESRLVTLVGIGGVGKTRLALRLAAELERAFPDGVYLADLTALRDPGLVPPTVAAALGLRDESTRWSISVLSDHLASRHALVVLDNCEHLLEPCAVLAETLLRSCPDLHLLATSRQTLAVPGELAYSVPPLSVPDADRPPPPPEALGQYEAVNLLIDRAQAAVPDFSLTSDNHVAVTRLAQRLDGIPLAVELAAARLRVLAPEQILSRLDDRYKLLRSGSRTVPPRQQSLGALIDWSFDLCSRDEQRLWARLAVFPTDFDLDAAEEVCSGGELAREAVLDVLAALVDKSILVAERYRRRVRYRLLETLREYGRERLSESDEVAVRKQHRDHYRRLAEDAEAAWFGPRQAEWSDRLQTDYPNLRAALEFCLSNGDLPDALAMTPALAFRWFVTGSLGEGRLFLDRLLAMRPAPSAARAKALWVGAMLAANQGDAAAGQAMSEECRELARAAGDDLAFSRGTQYLGVVRLLAGDRDAAAALFEEALTTARRIGEAYGIADNLIRLGQVRLSAADFAAAADSFRAAATTCRNQGESWFHGYALWNLAVARWRLQDRRGAAEAAKDSLRLSDGAGNHIGVARALEVLAAVATADGRHEHACRLLGAAMSLRETRGGSGVAHVSSLHDETSENIRRALGTRRFDASIRHGAQMGVGEAVALAEDAEPLRATPSGQRAVLTKRQREIADLVAQGLSNKEIAARLVISPRTAEAHVEHILTKLGYTSRAQIAAWAAEHRTSAT
jgi:predicted ATPase/DNA-binding CsgD family transcriptional regulator